MSVDGDCSWIIIETKKDDSFDEVFYHQDLKRRDELYKPFNNPVNFLKRFIETI